MLLHFILNILLLFTVTIVIIAYTQKQAHSVQCLACYPQNEDLELMSAGSNAVLFRRGVCARLTTFFLCENDNLCHFSFKSPPRRHRSYISIAKADRCFTKILPTLTRINMNDYVLLQVT